MICSKAIGEEGWVENLTKYTHLQTLNKTEILDVSSATPA